MKSETSRFPRALGSYRFPSLLAGKVMVSLHVAILRSGFWRLYIGVGVCPTPACPRGMPALPGTACAALPRLRGEAELQSN